MAVPLDMQPRRRGRACGRSGFLDVLGQGQAFRERSRFPQEAVKPLARLSGVIQPARFVPAQAGKGKRPDPPSRALSAREVYDLSRSTSEMSTGKSDACNTLAERVTGGHEVSVASGQETPIRVSMERLHWGAGRGIIGSTT